MTPYELSMVEQGLARWYRGRLIPIIQGGSGEDEPLFAAAPEDLSTLDDDALQALIDSYEATVGAISEDHTKFVTDDRDVTALLELAAAAADTLDLLYAEKAERAPVVDPAASFAELGKRVKKDEAAPVAEETEEPAKDEPAEEVVASGAKPGLPIPMQPASREPARQLADDGVSLVASSGVIGKDVGADFVNLDEISAQMIKRRAQFGPNIPDGVSGEKFPVARADWSDRYPAERRLGQDPAENMGLIAAATDPEMIKANFQARRAMFEQSDGKFEPGNSLTADGGLCAPVTPYYNLMMVSSNRRPVRGALASFNADRGGIRFATPASLSAVTTGVGIRTAAQDGVGGTTALKTCQVVPCPPFTEVDVTIIYHCIQFGNLAARTFPERVSQWNNLVLAQHARTAESQLLTNIGAGSTAVTAATLGIGAAGDLLGQILAAADGMRSRHRMEPDTVLRAIFPFWVVDLLTSDVIRSAFQRFDTDAARITALLRRANIEPTFHMDGATGKSQVYGTQSAGALLPFPGTVVWYLFPEGAWLYLDGGTLELGIVRDSVLNLSNNFQIFGETFENVAGVGVESLQITSTLCDSGAVAIAKSVTCPIAY